MNPSRACLFSSTGTLPFLESQHRGNCSPHSSLSGDGAATAAGGKSHQHQLALRKCTENQGGEAYDQKCSGFCSTQYRTSSPSYKLSHGLGAGGRRTEPRSEQGLGRDVSERNAQGGACPRSTNICCPRAVDV